MGCPVKKIAKKGGGSGLATLGIPSSPGVTQGAAKDTLTAPFNDLEAVRAIVAAQEALRSAEPAVLLSPIASGLTALLNSASEELRGLALTGLVGLNSAEVDLRTPVRRRDAQPTPAADSRDRRCSTDLVWIWDTRLSVTPRTCPISARVSPSS